MTSPKKEVKIERLSHMKNRTMQNDNKIEKVSTKLLSKLSIRMSNNSFHSRVLIMTMTILSLSTMIVSANWIDIDTPLDKRTTTSLVDGSIYHLVRYFRFFILSVFSVSFSNDTTRNHRFLLYCIENLKRRLFPL